MHCKRGLWWFYLWSVALQMSPTTSAAAVWLQIMIQSQNSLFEASPFVPAFTLLHCMDLFVIIKSLPTLKLRVSAHDLLPCFYFKCLWCNCGTSRSAETYSLTVTQWACLRRSHFCVFFDQTCNHGQSQTTFIPFKHRPISSGCTDSNLDVLERELPSDMS